MSIPLDRLYHYIESVAQEIHGDTIIYRFYPHGSKNIEDLKPLNPTTLKQVFMSIELVCHDQEPLCYDMYKNTTRSHRHVLPVFNDLEDAVAELTYTNLRMTANNIHNKCLLLHSEKNSSNLNKYQNDQYVPVYFWSHAVIARDWYRYAKYLNQHPKTSNKKFLVYNRAWSGTREYRLKLADLLINNHLVDQCKTNCFFIDGNTHYSQHNFINTCWRPTNRLEDYFDENCYPATSSADFCENDYKQTDIEIILETLFDDSRHHLTEKSLRPIALGQPFILASTAGSLEYLRSYGFKTFGSVIDETYDTIQDPYKRLEEIVKLMSTINNLPTVEYQSLMKHLNEISTYNKQHFFSDDFFKQLINELKTNLHQGFVELQSTNDYSRFINLRKKLDSNKNFVEWRLNTVNFETCNELNAMYDLALKLNNATNK